MASRECWTHWESAVLLLAIDWCTVQGEFEPNGVEIAKLTEGCVKFLMEEKSSRLLLSKPFNETSVRV
jgi:hypothetical protein